MNPPTLPAMRVIVAPPAPAVIDAGPWRGPTRREWVRRIEAGAEQIRLLHGRVD
jgi:hypothetical protein